MKTRFNIFKPSTGNPWKAPPTTLSIIKTQNIIPNIDDLQTLNVMDCCHTRMAGYMWVVIFYTRTPKHNRLKHMICFIAEIQASFFNDPFMITYAPTVLAFGPYRTIYKSNVILYSSYIICGFMDEHTNIYVPCMMQSGPCGFRFCIMVRCFKRMSLGRQTVFGKINDFAKLVNMLMQKPPKMFVLLIKTPCTASPMALWMTTFRSIKHAANCSNAIIFKITNHWLVMARIVRKNGDS